MLDWTTAWARGIAEDFASPDPSKAMDEIEANGPNVRAAHEIATGFGPGPAARLLAAFGPYGLSLTLALPEALAWAQAVITDTTQPDCPGGPVGAAHPDRHVSPTSAPTSARRGFGRRSPSPRNSATTGCSPPRGRCTRLVAMDDAEEALLGRRAGSGTRREGERAVDDRLGAEHGGDRAGPTARFDFIAGGRRDASMLAGCAPPGRDNRRGHDSRRSHETASEGLTDPASDLVLKPRRATPAWISERSINDNRLVDVITTPGRSRTRARSSSVRWRRSRDARRSVARRRRPRRR